MSAESPVARAIRKTAAFRIGFRAQRQGFPLAANPYKWARTTEGRAKSAQWEAGWINANTPVERGPQ